MENLYVRPHMQLSICVGSYSVYSKLCAHLCLLILCQNVDHNISHRPWIKGTKKFMPSLSHYFYFCSDKWHQTFMNIWSFELSWDAWDQHVRKAVWVTQLVSVHAFCLQEIPSLFYKNDLKHVNNLTILGFHSIANACSAQSKHSWREKIA